VTSFPFRIPDLAPDPAGDRLEGHQGPAGVLTVRPWGQSLSRSLLGPCSMPALSPAVTGCHPHSNKQDVRRGRGGMEVDGHCRAQPAQHTAGTRPCLVSPRGALVVTARGCNACERASEGGTSQQLLVVGVRGW
jgi:hypothetical protein